MPPRSRRRRSPRPRSRRSPPPRSRRSPRRPPAPSSALRRPRTNSRSAMPAPMTRPGVTAAASSADAVRSRTSSPSPHLISASSCPIAVAVGTTATAPSRTGVRGTARALSRAVSARPASRTSPCPTAAVRKATIAGRTAAEDRTATRARAASRTRIALRARAAAITTATAMMTAAVAPAAATGRGTASVVDADRTVRAARTRGVSRTTTRCARVTSSSPSPGSWTFATTTPTCATGYLPGASDVYVSMNQVRRHGLRKGDAITGQVKAPQGDGQADQQQRQQHHGGGRNRRNKGGQGKYAALVQLDTINGMTPERARSRVDFGKLTPLYPDERLRLETSATSIPTRVIDLVSPIGKGQRGLIVSPPKAGKTIIMQQIANAITTNNPEVHLMVVLVDERPEE